MIAMTRFLLSKKKTIGEFSNTCNTNYFNEPICPFFLNRIKSRMHLLLHKLYYL